MDEKNANLVILAHTEPNKLYDKSIDKPYSVSDVNFLAKQYANQHGANYFDLAGLFKYVLKNMEYDFNLANQAINKYQNTITGAIQIRKNDWYWLQLLMFYNVNKIKEKHKLIVPMLLIPGDSRAAHYAVMGFEFNPENRSVNIVILEQHAMNKENITSYDKNFDYSDMIDLLLVALKQYCKQFLHYENITTIKNEKPISHRKNVCGIVASEIAQRLSESDDWIDFVENPPVLSDEEINKIFERNKNYSINDMMQKTQQERDAK